MLLQLLLITVAPLKQITSVGHDMPTRIDPAARYVFYLHGRIIEEHGLQPCDQRFGNYEYEKILRTLERRGLRVISEARPQGTEPARYAKRVAEQVRSLFRAGVPPNHITIIGASKGGLIATLVSNEVAKKNVRYVLLGACSDDVFSDRVLFIHDAGDEFATSCRGGKQIETHLGLGHGLLYRPRPQWIDPAVAWARAE